MPKRSFKPFEPLEIFIISQEKNHEINEIQSWISDDFFNNNKFWYMNDNLKNTILKSLNELLEKAKNIKNKRNLRNFYESKNREIIFLKKYKMLYDVQQSLIKLDELRLFILNYKDSDLSKNEQDELLSNFTKIWCDLYAKIDEIKDIKVLPHSYFDSFSNCREQEKFDKINKEINTLNNASLLLEQKIFKKTFTKILDDVNHNLPYKSNYKEILGQLRDKFDEIELDKDSVYELDSKILEKEFTNLKEEFDNISIKIEEEKVERLDESKIYLKEEFNKLNITIEEKRKIFENINNSTSVDELKDLNFKFQYYKLKEENENENNKRMEEIIEFDRALNELHNANIEAFSSEKTENYLLKSVNEFEELFEKNKNGTDNYNRYLKSEKTNFAVTIATKLMNNSYFNENVKIWGEDDVSFVVGIIDQLYDIYTKTNDEAYNPSDEVVVIEFCLMSKEEKDEKFRNAITYSSDKKGRI